MPAQNLIRHFYSKQVSPLRLRLRRNDDSEGVWQNTLVPGAFLFKQAMVRSCDLLGDRTGEVVPLVGIDDERVFKPLARRACHSS